MFSSINIYLFINFPTCFWFNLCMYFHKDKKIVHILNTRCGHYISDNNSYLRGDASNIGISPSANPARSERSNKWFSWDVPNIGILMRANQHIQLSGNTSNISDSHKWSSRYICISTRTNPVRSIQGLTNLNYLIFLSTLLW